MLAHWANGSRAASATAVALAALVVALTFLRSRQRRETASRAACNTLSSKNLVALLVGVKSYRHYSPLWCTDADVEMVSKALKGKGFYTMEHVDCTWKELDRAFHELARELRDQRCEVLLFYFAGHAIETEGQNALLCVDSCPQYGGEEHTLNNCLRRLYECLAPERAPKTKIVAILDCCRKAGFQPLPTAVSFPRRGNFYVMFACGGGQVARETGGHGMFTKEFVDLLNSQAEFDITSEGFALLTQSVQRRTRGLQRPQLLCSNSDPWEAKIWNLPARNKCFVGRQVLLDDLEARLKEPGVLCLVATSGLAGVGKSQLVLELLHSRRRSRRIVWWLRAETLITLQHGLAQLATRISRATEVEAARQHAWTVFLIDSA